MLTKHDPRAYDIRIRLDGHFLNDVEVAVATPEPSWWWERYDTLGEFSILGWGLPVPTPDFEPGTSISPIIVPYCPEIIDEQTGELTLLELCAYLDIVEWFCDQWIIHWAVEDLDERYQVVDGMLAERFPDSHANLHEMVNRAKIRYGV